METVNLNAELIKSLEYLETDENDMQKELTEMCEQIKQAKEGKLQGEPAENLFNELHN